MYFRYCFVKNNDLKDYNFNFLYLNHLINSSKQKVNELF